MFGHEGAAFRRMLSSLLKAPCIDIKADSVSIHMDECTASVQGKGNNDEGRGRV